MTRIHYETSLPRFQAVVASVAPLSGSLQPPTPFAALGKFAGTVLAR